MSSESRVNELERIIPIAAQEYYESGNDIMFDGQFNKLIEELRSIDPDNDLLHKVGWGYDVRKSNRKKCRHWYGPVEGISLKVNDIHNHGMELIPKVYSGKFDGGSVEHQYKNGYHVHSVSRGDGIEGLEVTHKFINKIPQYLTRLGTNEPFTGSIRGEFILPIEIWRLRYSDSPSPRNVATGMLTSDNYTNEQLDDFYFVAYAVHGVTGGFPFLCVSDIFKWLQESGFITPVHYFRINQDGDLKELMQEMSLILGTEYHSLLDGIVIAGENIRYKQDGTIVYNYAAYKPESEKVQAKVIDVVYRLTRTGMMKPRVNIEPTSVSGATFDYITAFNAWYVKEMGLGPGAVVEFMRSGEVIPDITDIVEKVDPKLPTHCPHCNSGLVWEGTDLWCKNPDCIGRSESTLYHWIFNVAPVDGLGGTIVEKLVKFFNIVSPKDLYENEYDIDKLYVLDGLGESTVKLVRKMFDKLKQPIDPRVFLIALNIKGLGWESAEKLMNHFGTLPEILMAEREEFSVIPRLTYVVADGICNQRDYISNLMHLVNIGEMKKEEKSEVSVRMRVVRTGKIGITESKLAEKLSKLNIEVQGGISTDEDSKTDYLITNKQIDGDNLSSKLKAALSSGIQIVNEETFLKNILKIDSWDDIQ